MLRMHMVASTIAALVVFSPWMLAVLVIINIAVLLLRIGLIGMQHASIALSWKHAGLWSVLVLGAAYLITQELDLIASILKIIPAVGTVLSAVSLPIICAVLVHLSAVTFMAAMASSAAWAKQKNGPSEFWQPSHANRC